MLLCKGTSFFPTAGIVQKKEIADMKKNINLLDEKITEQ
tara:strand:+ start:124 stop:240 length:117 start_codon:yes stop_codon:yes gene_type:complete